MLPLRSKKRAIIIGLDCADPDLVFNRWIDDLPNIRRVLEAGVYGRMRSCTPPITVPAWMSMMTSRDPGELGFYGFRNRADYTYSGLSIASSASVQQSTSWDILGAAGKHSIVIGVPPTYPPKPLKGELLTCFLTPTIERPFTYPEDLRNEVERVVGEYMVDVKGFRTDNKEWLLSQIYEMTDKRFALATHLLKTRPWDFFMMVEMGVDRIHHGFWQYMDAKHVLHEPDTSFESAIHDYYVHVDRNVGELLEHVDKNTLVLIVSDHGAKRMDGGICLNEWLIARGHLVLNEYPSTLTRFEKLDVNWRQTKAWGEGGYYGRVFLNVKGREPDGALNPTEYESFRAQLIEELEALGDEEGISIGTRVVRPEDAYREIRNIPPDLMVFFGNLYWRSAGTVGHRTIHIRENDTGPDGANHDWDGIFLMASGRELAHADRRRADALPDLNLMDVPPTILEHFGLRVPSSMQGRLVSARRD